jgi:hypothetical protein
VQLRNNKTIIHWSLKFSVACESSFWNPNTALQRLCYFKTGMSNRSYLCQVSHQLKFKLVTVITSLVYMLFVSGVARLSLSRQTTKWTAAETSFSPSSGTSYWYKFATPHPKALVRTIPNNISGQAGLSPLLFLDRILKRIMNDKMRLSAWKWMNC